MESLILITSELHAFIIRTNQWRHNTPEDRYQIRYINNLEFPATNVKVLFQSVVYNLRIKTSPGFRERWQTSKQTNRRLCRRPAEVPLSPTPSFFLLSHAEERDSTVSFNSRPTSHVPRQISPTLSAAPPSTNRIILELNSMNQQLLLTGEVEPFIWYFRRTKIITMSCDSNKDLKCRLWLKD